MTNLTKKDFSVKITKITDLGLSPNCIYHSYMFSGRIYDREKSAYKKFKTVVTVKVDALKTPRECAYEELESILKCIKSFDDCEDFLELCDEILNNYNITFK